ncbi:MAG: hypothetical protein FWE40_02240 [Oscillospiraceae bacterium]|nr:hypothetical protein [Oscillospiraceae bacterium]
MDQKTLAYINMHAIIGALENLCELDPEASAMVANEKPLVIAWDVAGGPKATMTFAKGRMRLDTGILPKHNLKMKVSSCAQFNQVVGGKANPTPVPKGGGVAALKFMLNDFTKLTGRLEKFLRATEEDLADPVISTISTKLMLNVIGVAISQIGDYDPVGKFSAKYITDGDVQISIKGDLGVTIRVKDHFLTTIKQRPETPSAIMEFESLELARALFDGKVNAMSCIGQGQIIMGGKINMLDNVNRILDRVPLYLAA